jgi:hypothetical protein
MSKNSFPPGWDDARVRKVIAHYEAQGDDEQFAEVEAALDSESTTMIAVPIDLVPEVRAIIARAKEK